MIEAIFCPSGECIALTAIEGCSTIHRIFPEEYLQKATRIAELALTFGPLMSGVTDSSRYSRKLDNNNSCITTYINGTSSKVNYSMYSHSHYIEMELPVSEDSMPPYWYEEFLFSGERYGKGVIFALGNFSFSSSRSIEGAIGIFFMLSSPLNGANRFFTSAHHCPFPSTATQSTALNCLNHIAITALPIIETSTLHPLDILRRVLAENSSNGELDARKVSVAVSIEMYYTALQHPLSPGNGAVKDDSITDAEEIESLVRELQCWAEGSDRSSPEQPTDAGAPPVSLADAFFTLMSVDYKLKDPSSFAGKDVLRAADSAAMKQYKKEKKKYNLKNLIRKIRATPFGSRGAKKIIKQMKQDNETNDIRRAGEEHSTNEGQDGNNAVEESLSALKSYMHSRLGAVINEKPFVRPSNISDNRNPPGTRIVTKHLHSPHYCTLLMADIGLLHGYEHQPPPSSTYIPVAGFAIVYPLKDNISPIVHTTMMAQQLQRVLLEAPSMLQGLIIDNCDVTQHDASLFSPVSAAS